MSAAIRGLCLVVLLARGLCAAEPKLFGRGPDALRTAVQNLIRLQDQGFPTMLSPVQTFPKADVHQSLVIVVGDAVAGGTDQIRAFLDAGGCVLMVSGEPAAVDFYRSLGLPVTGGKGVDRVGRGWATANIDESFLSNATLATEPGGTAMRDALEQFRTKASVRWIRVVNRLRYGINPESEPSYTPPEYVEDLAAPRFTDSNVISRGYHYTAGQAQQLFKDFEYTPHVRTSFVRMKAFDAFVDGHFSVSKPDFERLAISSTAAPGFEQHEGKVDSQEVFRGGEAIVIPSLGPDAVLMGFEVRSLQGGEWQRRAVVHDGDGSTPPAGMEYREFEEEEGAGLFFRGRKVKVRRLVPRLQPGGEGAGEVESVGTMGTVFAWSDKSQWKRDALNNWALYLPHPDELPPADRDAVRDGLRFTLKYRVAFKPTPYLVPKGSNFTAAAIPAELTLRDATHRLSGLAGTIPAAERTELDTLLRAERRPGEPYFPAALSAVNG